MMIRQTVSGTKNVTRVQARVRLALAALGILGLTGGCKTSLPLNQIANAESLPAATPTQPPTATATPLLPTPTATLLPPTPTLTATATPWPTATARPTATPWPTPAAWRPAPAALPSLAPLPVIAASANVPSHGLVPFNYSPPDGVDVFGNVVLRWEFMGELAEDEFFDIKIRPLGSNDSVFVDWSKSPEYTLRPWNGWTPGLYTWQIGIIKGTLEGETKHFNADTGRDSEPLLIKWQAAGGGGGGGGAAGGGGSSGGSSGGS